MSTIATITEKRQIPSRLLQAAIAVSHALRPLPGASSLIDSVRFRRLKYLANSSPETMTRYELDQLVAMAVKRRVIDGPFRGMRYLKRAHGSVLSAKLLGSYERELREWWDEILLNEYRKIWVVGSGEGYYTVGLARCMPDSEIVAFDIAAEARLATLDLALLNNVADRLTIGKACQLQKIADEAPHRALIVCDIEGEERSLLTSLPAEQLAHCDLVVEVHDTPPSCETLDLLLDHFALTHRIQAKHSEVRDPSLVNWPTGIKNPKAQQRLVSEGRFRGNRWLYMTPTGNKEAT